MALIVRAVQQQGMLARIARVAAGVVHEGPIVAMPSRHGPVRTRLFEPTRPVRRTAILVPGLHTNGIREQRLVALARELAASGLAVLTIAPPALTRYRVTTDSTDEIEDAITWTASRKDLAPDGRVGVMGISFAGGLALVAAGRPAVRDKIAFVLSLGGHADLLRVLRYLCLSGGGKLDDRARAFAEGGEHIRIPKPNDYGSVVSLLNLADQVVPAEQVAPLQEAITVFLEASSIDRLDPSRAAAQFARARQLGATLPEPGRTLMAYVNYRDVSKLGQALAPLLAHLNLPAGLSPERSPTPTAPIFLLHGADDSVVPASEMIRLVQHLRAVSRGPMEVRAFASRLISHAEAKPQSALAEMWHLADFWREIMEK